MSIVLLALCVQTWKPPDFFVFFTALIILHMNLQFWIHISISSYPDMKLIYTQPAHSSNCICIKFDPSGQYFATGSADALMSLWDIDDLTCLRTFSR